MSHQNPQKTTHTSLFPEPPGRIVIIFRGTGSDLLRAGFFFKSVRTHFPDAFIHFLTLPHHADLVKYAVWFNSVGYYKGGFDFFRQIGLLRAEPADLLINLDQGASRLQYYSAVWGKAVRSAGFKTADSGDVFNWQADVTDHPVFSLALIRLAEKLGIVIPRSASRPQLTIGPKEFQNARRQLAQVNPQKAPVIAVNLSASDKDRYWKKDHWWNFLLRLKKTDLQVKLLLLYQPGDAQISKDIATPFAPGSVIFPAYSDPQHQAAYLVQADLVISADSWLLEVAEAFKIPAIGILPESHRAKLLSDDRQGVFEAVFSAQKSVKDIPISSVYDAYCRIRPGIHRLVSGGSDQDT